jgi:tetratricopeptide (TPR) repeat protein
MEGDQAQSENFTIRANDLAVYTPPVDTLVDKLSLLTRSDLYLLKKIDEAEKGGYPEWAMKLMINGFQYMPDNMYLISKFIRLYLVMNYGNQSSPLFEKHRALYRNDFNEMFNFGYLLYNKGLYQQSLIYYRLARQIKPQDIDTEKGILLCLWHTGGKKMALDSTLVWLNRNPGNNLVLKEGVSLLLNLKEKALTKAYFERLKKLSLQDPDVMALSGKIAESEGNVSEALKWYEAALKEKPDELSYERLLIQLLTEQKLWQKSISCIREALRYHPNEPYLLERMGTLLISCPETGLRNPGEAKEFSERAFIHITSEPSILISAGRSLSIAYATLGDRGNAFSTMQSTIDLARKENLSEASIAEMEVLLKAFRQ